MTYDGTPQGQHSLVVPDALDCPNCHEDMMDRLRILAGEADFSVQYTVRCMTCNTDYNPIDMMLDDEDQLAVLLAQAELWRQE